MEKVNVIDKMPQYGNGTVCDPKIDFNKYYFESKRLEGLVPRNVENGTSPENYPVLSSTSKPGDKVRVFIPKASYMKAEISSDLGKPIDPSTGFWLVGTVLPAGKTTAIDASAGANSREKVRLQVQLNQKMLDWLSAQIRMRGDSDANWQARALAQLTMYKDDYVTLTFNPNFTVTGKGTDLNSFV